MITIIESKNFLESDAQAIVNFVSCSGEAINFDGEKIFEQNPEMFKKYLGFCGDGKLKPGMIWYYKGKDKEILNFAVSKGSDSREIQLEDFKNGLIKLKQIIENKNINSIAITNIVQLNDIIDFNALYDDMFYDCPFNVEVYNYKMIHEVSPQELVQDEYLSQDKTPSKQNDNKSKNSVVTHITYPENTIFHI